MHIDGKSTIKGGDNRTVRGGDGRTIRDGDDRTMIEDRRSRLDGSIKASSIRKGAKSSKHEDHKTINAKSSIGKKDTIESRKTGGKSKHGGGGGGESEEEDEPGEKGGMQHDPENESAF